MQLEPGLEGGADSNTVPPPDQRSGGLCGSTVGRAETDRSHTASWRGHGTETEKNKVLELSAST